MTMTGKELKAERTKLGMVQARMTELTGIRIPLLSAIEQSDDLISPATEKKVRKALREFKRLKRTAA
jgi:transcriptional regulator with XRE-family HTH domain